MENKQKTEGKTSTEAVGVTETAKNKRNVFEETQEYKNMWNSHIDSLNRLYFLADSDSKKLDKALQELKTIVTNNASRLAKRIEKENKEVIN